MTPNYRVYNCVNYEMLEGAPSEALIKASLEAGDSAVLARRMTDGTWDVATYEHLIDSVMVRIAEPFDCREIPDGRDAYLDKVRRAVTSMRYSHTTTGHVVAPDSVHVYHRDPTSPTGCQHAVSISKDDAEALALLRGRTVGQAMLRGASV